MVHLQYHRPPLVEIQCCSSELALLSLPDILYRHAFVLIFQFDPVTLSRQGDFVTRAPPSDLIGLLLYNNGYHLSCAL